MLKSEERGRKIELGRLYLKEDNYRQGLFDEEERIQRVRFIVDSASDRLQYSDLAWDEARQKEQETFLVPSSEFRVKGTRNTELGRYLYDIV